jgi:anti-anti-sigma factor
MAAGLIPAQTLTRSSRTVTHGHLTLLSNPLLKPGAGHILSTRLGQREAPVAAEAAAPLTPAGCSIEGEPAMALDHVSDSGQYRTVPPVNLLSFSTSQCDGHMRIEVAGELDEATAPLLREQLFNVHADLVGDLVLDISALTFVDSTGLSLFLTMHKRLRSEGKRLVIFAPTPKVRRVMEITRLDEYLHVQPQHC